MRILVTGAGGMLGRTLVEQFSTHELIPVGRNDFDLIDTAATMRAVRDARPNVVLHCAAMTAVDDCEREQDRAFAVNALGSAHIAAASHAARARLVAFSTDYVFSGEHDRPYHEWDRPAPKTVYGRSKLAGEEAVRQHCPDHVIARIAWLYGPDGPSFVHTMLDLGQRDGDPLRVVDDQHGNPTSTLAVARHISQLIEMRLVGTVHLTCEGETTWYGFAREIFQHAGLQRGARPCTTQAFRRPAHRPANSRLENRVLRLTGAPPMPHWRDALRSFLSAYPDG